jgi:hypothetical protein
MASSTPSAGKPSRRPSLGKLRNALNGWTINSIRYEMPTLESPDPEHPAQQLICLEVTDGTIVKEIVLDRAPRVVSDDVTYYPPEMDDD